MLVETGVHTVCDAHSLVRIRVQQSQSVLPPAKEVTSSPIPMLTETVVPIVCDAQMLLCTRVQQSRSMLTPAKGVPQKRLCTAAEPAAYNECCKSSEDCTLVPYLNAFLEWPEQHSDLVTQAWIDCLMQATVAPGDGDSCCHW